MRLSSFWHSGWAPVSPSLPIDSGIGVEFFVRWRSRLVNGPVIQYTVRSSVVTAAARHGSRYSSESNGGS
jgi:hypothetical protein